MAKKPHDLRRATSPITDAINADPKEVERLREARQQVREGNVHWEIDDDTCQKPRRIERFSCDCADYADSFDCEHAQEHLRVMAELRPHVIVALVPYDFEAARERRRERERTGWMDCAIARWRRAGGVV